MIDAAKKGELKEAFASGTAAVISPMGLLRYLGEEYVISDRKVGALSQRIYDTISGIQTGKIADTRGWTQACGFNCDGYAAIYSAIAKCILRFYTAGL